MVYFMVMGAVAWFAVKKEKIDYKIIDSSPWKTTLLFSAVMVVFFAVTLGGYKLIEGGAIRLELDTRRWAFFTRPWKEINLFVSVAGIVLVVAALEFFYRVYAIGMLRRSVSKQKALFISSFASALRGLISGPVAGLYDFSLSYLWGTVYMRSGFIPALIVHLVWDILFVYISPG
jgi:hypothetical protein